MMMPHGRDMPIRPFGPPPESFDPPLHGSEFNMPPGPNPIIPVGIPNWRRSLPSSSSGVNPPTRPSPRSWDAFDGRQLHRENKRPRTDGFQPLEDLYYKTWLHREPRGFGFVLFVEPADVAEAKYQMDGQILLGRRWSLPPCYSRSPRYARSRPSRYARSPSPCLDYSPAPRRRHYSRLVSPVEKRYSRERSYSGSLVRDLSPSHDGAPRSPSRSLVNGSRSRSHSPVRDVSRSPSRSRS